ncbi:RagB/SusD family nutrient uptake outer membrane protein [Gabonibacter chumensis]|uniref:RagB/SusD family nutrient uptake outer membrane protein n=1 Tax=Gabonibacter chumensis TaxID=2972474 RepID=UPI0025742265|nr:RagB/SusD family nutrient uptake outer membrane protein [Gabonibacter chumensis]MCR9011874.1 RagB/SusD family nutrient uptake outer membrane protein [Gabonibacter chumensis]
MNRIYSFMILVMFCMTSCGDFLEEYSTQLNYATSSSDLEELLVGGGYLPFRTDTEYYVFSVVGEGAPDFPWIHVMDDDVTDYLNTNSPHEDNVGDLLAAFYCWQKNPFSKFGESYRDITWERMYERIGVMNVILGKVDEFTEDPVELRNRIKGEALFLRANFYFLLVNFYAKPYAERSAVQEPGVPVKITDEVVDKYYSRNSVAETYKQIVTDLGHAVKCLSGLSTESVFQANQSAARILLSRVYLYMGEWEKALQQCDSVGKEYGLLDLVDRDVNLDFTYEASPETVFTQGSYTMGALMKNLDMWKHCFQVSDDLYGLYSEGDLRRKNFFKIVSGYYEPAILVIRKWNKPYDKPKISDNCLIRYAEVYLNKAEALAMLDRDAEAIRVIQELRAKRFVPGEEVNTYLNGERVAVNSLSGERLVQFIRDERRRELCLEGHRWFDLRRYAVSPKYPMEKEIRHKYFVPGGQSTEYYLLKKYSEDGGWVLPIPDYVITFNNGLIKDNEREDRNAL